MNNIKTKKIKDIKIEDIPVYMTTALLKTLENNNIKTLDNLFEFAKHSSDIVKNMSDSIYNELIGLTNLLRCKYLGEDPGFNLQDTNIKKNLSKMGLSTSTYNSLSRFSDIDKYKTLEEYLTHYTTASSMKRIRGMGKEKILEFRVKANIILNYYKDNKKEEEIVPSISETTDNKELLALISLNDELKKLIEERDNLDRKINEVVQKINEKSSEISKNTK